VGDERLLPEDYDALLKQARDSRYGIRLAMQGFTPGARVRRRLYSARDRARKRGDKTFDSLSIIFTGLTSDIFGPSEIWIVRRDCLPKREDPDDKLEIYPSDLEFHDLPPFIRARGPKPDIPQHSLGPDPYGCVDPISCKIMKPVLKGEIDNPAEQLAAADAALPDPDPRDAREMTLEQAGYFLERLAAMRQRDSRSRS
jgi:hypothetical protein